MLTWDLIMLFSPFPAAGLSVLIRAVAAPPPLTKWEALCFAPFAICCILAVLALMGFSEHIRDNPALTDEERKQWRRRIWGAWLTEAPRYWSKYRDGSQQALTR